MKEFNLAEALAGKPVVTRDGRKVVEMHHFKSLLKNHPVYALIEGNKWAGSYTGDGKSRNDGTCSDIDLFMATVEKTAWVNMYAGYGYAYCTEAEANESANHTRIGKAHKLTYTE